VRVQFVSRRGAENAENLQVSRKGAKARRRRRAADHRSGPLRQWCPLVGGWRGMLVGLGWFAVANVVLGVARQLGFMVAIYISAIAGVVPATPTAWSVGVAALVLSAGPAIGALRGGRRSAQTWSVGWSVFVTACIVIVVFVLAMVRGIGGR